MGRSLGNVVSPTCWGFYSRLVHCLHPSDVSRPSCRSGLFPESGAAPGVSMNLMPSKSARALPAAATGAHAIGTSALGSIAIGAVALGAMAIGAVSIGRLFVGRARIRRLDIDEFVVRRI